MTNIEKQYTDKLKELNAYLSKWLIKFGSKAPKWIELESELVILESAIKQGDNMTPTEKCKHEHITSSDGCDECLDCRVRNY